MLDRLKTELRASWEKGDRLRVTELRDRTPELRGNHDALQTLVLLELELTLRFEGRIDRERFLKDYPECDGLIRSFGIDQSTVDMTLVKPDKTLVLSDATQPIREPSIGNRYPTIPGFEILSELGRGGMGIVYRARQISANRLVALKVVRGEVLDAADAASRSSALDRFQTEARAAAALQHDHVVQVYEVGEVPAKEKSGTPLSYYAMRFVEGKSLHELLRDGPLDSRRSANYIAQVARALQAAHDLGILHRDMKPHNVMVEAATDRALVADFGLAKILKSDHSMTMAGQVMGTPAYMPPEQIRDASTVTASADQYALGVTLYHLLAGHPPFAASNLEELFRQILEKPPVRLRDNNPAIDRDLETICMKAIEKEPSRRYPSCRDLAEDLDRYLRGIPIIARPIHPVERTWRWCRRNPSLAGLIATATILALVALGAILLGYRNTQAALQFAQFQRDRTIGVLDELFTKVSEEDLLDEPGMQGLRRDLLERALPHYKAFLAESQGNSKLADKVAATWFRIGRIRESSGDVQGAVEAFEEARLLQEKLIKEPSTSQRKEELESQREGALGDTLNAFGKLRSKQNNTLDAMKLFEESYAYREKRAKQSPRNLDLQRAECNTLMNLGLSYVANEDTGNGLERIARAQRRREELLSEFPKSDKLLQEIAEGWYTLGKVTMARGDIEQTNSYLSKSTDAFEELYQLNKTSLRIQSEYGVALRLLGVTYCEQGEPDRALEFLKRAVPLTQRLADANPEVLAYRIEAGQLAIDLASSHAATEDWNESERWWQKGIEVQRALLLDQPKDPRIRRDLADCLSGIASVYEARGSLALAAARTQEAIQLLEELISEDPQSESIQEALDQNRENLKRLRTN